MHLSILISLVALTVVYAMAWHDRSAWESTIKPTVDSSDPLVRFKIRHHAKPVPTCSERQSRK